MFDFRIKVFLTVAKRLSFTKAAGDLFISQPAVTKHIKELEQYFKVQLFERKGNMISLTKEGQVMLQYSEQLFSLYRKMEFDLTSASGKRQGLLYIGASSTISQYVIPAILAKFRLKHAGIAIKLMNGNTEQVEHALLNHDIDMGIIEGKSRNRIIKYTRYINDEIILVASPNNPMVKQSAITIDELKNIPLLVREAGSGTLDIISAALKPLGLSFPQLNIEMDVGSTEAIKTYLRHSNCMAFLSVHSVIEEMNNHIFQVVKVQGLKIERFFYFIERQGTSEPLTNLFMQYACQHNLK